MILILFFILSLLPSFFLYLWLKNLKKDDEVYKKICSSAFIKGLFLSTLGAFLFSCVLYIVEIVLKVVGLSESYLFIYHNFILLGLSEELIKFFVFKHVVKKNKYDYTSIDLIALMMIVALGFQILESCFYGVGANIPTMLIRGLTIMHGGYGFLIGYFLVKGIQNNSKAYSFLAIFIPFILHGSYDFFLSSYIKEVNPDLGMISLLLAVISIVIMIWAIIYINKSKKNDDLNKPLNLENTNFKYKVK